VGKYFKSASPNNANAGECYDSQPMIPVKITPLGCTLSSDMDDYTTATRYSYYEPAGILNPTPLPSSIEAPFALLNDCQANDLYDMQGKLLRMRPKQFLIYAYNKNTSPTKILNLNFPDRANGYLAYVGPNNTHM
jgi:hypothetical protein